MSDIKDFFDLISKDPFMAYFWAPTMIFVIIGWIGLTIKIIDVNQKSINDWKKRR